MNQQIIHRPAHLPASSKENLDLAVAALLQWLTAGLARGHQNTMQKTLSLLCLTALAVSPLRAADEVPQRIDVSSLPAKVMDDVVVPVPSEVFNVLDKLGEPNWHGVLRSVSESSKTPAERPEIALLMGSVIAEGFIAVQAQDAVEVKKIGREMLKLAGALGVREHVVKRTEAIVEFADAKNWVGVRSEFDVALRDVRAAMSDLRDDELAQLVSLGGWLRGTEAVTQIVERDYSAARAELLHQPVLLDYFSERINAMGSRIKDNATVSKIEKRLPELRPLISVPNGVIEEASVRQISGITGDMVKSVMSIES